MSLAPRYIGRFEKGVDYIGDVSEFDADLADHAAITRTISPDGRYKLSLHSGSDKFTIYPAVVRQTRGLTHLKTAGTSYLEALRTIAALDAGLFREGLRNGPRMLRGRPCELPCLGTSEDVCRERSHMSKPWAKRKPATWRASSPTA